MSTFGEIPGYPEGREFARREDVRVAGLHRHTVRGISGTARDGVDAIVLSDGYKDDIDSGDVIIYTGEGGRDPGTKHQVRDQEFSGGNAGLVESCLKGYPVRVIRGSQLQNRFAPTAGYRYCGLYTVQSYWQELGIDGFRIIRFRLEKIHSSPETVPPTTPLPTGSTNPPQQRYTISRVVRDTNVTCRIKEIYDFCCQVCGVRLETSQGYYAEAAHIRPLGRPHNGPDTLDNVLCLCPNHHVLFDRGALTIDNTLTVRSISRSSGASKLFVHPTHLISLEMLAYHRDHFGFSTETRS